MSYSSAIEQLSAMVPELHVASGRPRRKFSLEEIRLLLAGLGNPHTAFPSVLIAGTNGKGSTAATLASILSQAGLRTGLYTSPHLERINERIRIGAEEIGEEDFAAHFDRVIRVADGMVASGTLPQRPSFFEVLTALAFSYFKQSRIDIAVLEVGMGGRLDATNVVEPKISIITDISFDHMEWLGTTLEEIAREKAGILRDGGVLVALSQQPEVNRVLDEIAGKLNVRKVKVARYLPALGQQGSYEVEIFGRQVRISSPLVGEHQQRNIALALAAAAELAAMPEYASITVRAIEDGVRETIWPGRLEQRTAFGREWLLDVAHNAAGAEALKVGLNTVMQYTSFGTLVFSCLKDKPVTDLAKILFPLFERVILAPIQSPRAASLETLAEAARQTGIVPEIAGTVEEALRKAAERADKPIVISGSVYLVGEARALLRRNQEAAR